MYEELMTVDSNATSGQVPVADGNGSFAWSNASELVSPSSTTPAMDGTAAVGTETTYARGDHVHPTDTSRAASTHDHGNIYSNGKISGATTIGSNDGLVFADWSMGNLISKSTISFDGSTATKALTQKGTWETFATMSTATTTIATSDWSSSTCTKSVTGVTASNTVIVAADPASHDVASNAGVYCNGQGAGTLSFVCSTTPSASITVNVLMLG